MAGRAWNILTDEVPVDGIRPGARVDTPTGEVAVETLREGDPVLVEGGVGVVAWLGRFRPRPHDAGRIAGLRPVCIAAEALGPRRPRRALWVAPDQAVRLDGADGPVLVAARRLVNDVSVRLGGTEAIDYVQVGLRQGACLSVEGTPLRSADGPADVLPDPADRRPPVADSGPALAWASGVVDRRAGLRGGPLRGLVGRIAADAVSGWVIDRAEPGRPVELELIVGGRLAATAVADLVRTDLGANLGHAACGFRLAMPPGLRGMQDIVVRQSGGADLYGGAVLLDVPGADAAAERAAALAGMIEVIDGLRRRRAAG
jgi:hypothetical protein